MKFRLPFLVFALGTGLAFVAPTAAQAQVGINVQIGAPAWGPAVQQGTQYYYIPEIDGYYDIYNGTYLVFDGQQWITQPYIDGYDPYYFHPVPVSYVGPQPWLYIGTYRARYPQYVTGYRRGGFGGGGHYDHDYGSGRVYGYDHGYNGNYGANRGYGGRPFDGNRGYAQPNGNAGRRDQPFQGQGNRGGQGGFGSQPGGQLTPGRGGFSGRQPGGNPSPGGQPTPGRGGQGGNPGGGGGRRDGGGQPGGGGGRRDGH